MYVSFGLYDCFMHGGTIPPNQPDSVMFILAKTMEKRRTNEEVRSNELKQVSARKTRPNQF